MITQIIIMMIIQPLYSKITISPINKVLSMDQGSVMKYVGLFIGVTILFLVVAELYPTAGAAGDDLNASGFPLGSLFVTGGVVFIVIAAAILMGVLKKSK